MAYKVQYKCRKCGKIENGGSVPKFLDIAKMIQGIPDVEKRQLITVSWHTCEDGSIGVTDVIGAEEYTYGEKE